MKILHSIPNRAAIVAVATPCCPAPVSAMTFVLPMRRARMPWPTTLLILCAPVWLQSSRLRKILGPPACAVRRSQKSSGEGRPA